MSRSSNESLDTRPDVAIGQLIADAQELELDGRFAEAADAWDWAALVAGDSGDMTSVERIRLSAAHCKSEVGRDESRAVDLAAALLGLGELLDSIDRLDEAVDVTARARDLYRSAGREPETSYADDRLAAALTRRRCSVALQRLEAIARSQTRRTARPSPTLGSNAG